MKRFPCCRSLLQIKDKVIPCCRSLLKPQWALPHTPRSPLPLPAVEKTAPPVVRVHPSPGYTKGPGLTTNPDPSTRPSSPYASVLVSNSSSTPATRSPKPNSLSKASASVSSCLRSCSTNWSLNNSRAYLASSNWTPLEILK